MPSRLVLWRLHQLPVRSAKTVYGAAAKAVLFPAYLAPVWNHCRPAAGIAFHRMHLIICHFFHNPCMANALAVLKENLIPRLRSSLKILAMVFKILCGGRRICTKPSPDKLPGCHLPEGLHKAPVHKHIAPGLALEGRIQIPGVLCVIVASCVGRFAV